jgi:Domain of unknown function (DUF5671)
MAIDDELRTFVKEGLTRGVARSELENVLLRAGWTGEQVRAALDGYADVPFAIPVPRPKPYVSAREAFMYLVLFSTLYVSAFNLGRLIFQLINHALPDPAAPDFVVQVVRRALRSSIASLVVGYPVFLYVSNLVSRNLRADPNKRLSKIRRWLTYLTLFLAAGVIIGDLIALLNNLLGGELTTRFVLKAVTAGSIAGLIFGYYLWDLRLDEGEMST